MATSPPQPREGNFKKKRSVRLWRSSSLLPGQKTSREISHATADVTNLNNTSDRCSVPHSWLTVWQPTCRNCTQLILELSDKCEANNDNKLFVTSQIMQYWPVWYSSVCLNYVYVMCFLYWTFPKELIVLNNNFTYYVISFIMYICINSLDFFPQKLVITSHQ